MSWSRRGSGLLAAGALLLAGGLVAPTTASAATVSFTDAAGITYEVDEGDVSAGATVKSYTSPGAGSSVTIPDTVEINATTYDVVVIWQSAFNNKNLTEVTVGDNVTTLKPYAFARNAIDTLHLGAAVEKVGHSAFLENDLQTLQVPNSVKEFGPHAFSDNELASLDLGTGVQEIGTGAFKNNYLSDVEFPESTTFIGWDSFLNNDFATVEIPSAVTQVGPGAFDDNPALTSVVFHGPAPMVERAVAGDAPSFDSSSGSLVLSYPWRFGVPETARGYESPTWEGYDTQAVATVDFDLNGQGSPAPAGQDVVVGETATEPAAPTAANFAFTGWFTDVALTNEFDFTAPVQADVTLYASWEAEVAVDDLLSVTKTVEAEYVRVYSWALAKSGAVAEVSVDGETASADVEYAVTATPEGARNAYYTLHGEITVTNEIVEPMTFTVTDVADIGVDTTCRISDDGSPVAEDDELELAPQESVTLDYRCRMDGNPDDGTNTAVVTWWGGEGQTSVTEDVIFEQRATSFETINVGDDKTTPEDGFVELGEAQWNSDGTPTEFTYTLTQSDLPVGECTSFTNTAMIAQTEQSTEATVEVCPEPVTAPTPTPTPTPDPDPSPSADPVVPVQSETNGLPKTGVDSGGQVAAALLFIVAGGAAVMIRRKVRN